MSECVCVHVCAYMYGLRNQGGQTANNVHFDTTMKGLEDPAPVSAAADHTAV